MAGLGRHANLSGRGRTKVSFAAKTNGRVTGRVTAVAVGRRTYKAMADSGRSGQGLTAATNSGTTLGGTSPAASPATLNRPARTRLAATPKGTSSSNAARADS